MGNPQSFAFRLTCGFFLFAATTALPAPTDTLNTTAVEGASPENADEDTKKREEAREKFLASIEDYLNAPAVSIPTFTLGSRHAFTTDNLEARVAEAASLATKLSATLARPDLVKLPLGYEWYNNQVIRPLKHPRTHSSALRSCRKDGGVIWGPSQLYDLVDLGLPKKGSSNYLWVQLGFNFPLSSSDANYQSALYQSYANGDTIPEDFNAGTGLSFSNSTPTKYKGAGTACLALEVVDYEITNRPCDTKLSAVCVLPYSRIAEIRWATSQFQLVEHVYRPALLNLAAKVASSCAVLKQVIPVLPTFSCPNATEDSPFKQPLLNMDVLDDTLNVTGWVNLHLQLTALQQTTQETLWRHQILGLVKSDGSVCDALVHHRLSRPHHLLQSVVKTIHTVVTNGTVPDDEDYFTYDTDDSADVNTSPGSFYAFTLIDVILAGSTFVVATLSILNRCMPPASTARPAEPLPEEYPLHEQSSSVHSVRFQYPPQRRRRSRSLTPSPPSSGSSSSDPTAYL